MRLRRTGTGPGTPSAPSRLCVFAPLREKTFFFGTGEKKVGSGSSPQ
jgi:hypothetical protein